MAIKKVWIGNVRGPQGDPGAVTQAEATIEDGAGTPQVTVELSGENKAKKLDFSFSNLRGATFTPSVDGDGWITFDNDRDLPNPEKVNIKGPKGDPGTWVPSGSAENIVLGDGSEKSITALLQENIETIRAAIGLVTKANMGLAPQLPENPEVE